MSDSERTTWYVVKSKAGTCQIKPGAAIETTDQEQWGPFKNQGEAIAKRVGLIRAGKCQPE
jgi:hypothetical protein